MFRKKRVSHEQVIYAQCPKCHHAQIVHSQERAYFPDDKIDTFIEAANDVEFTCDRCGQKNKVVAKVVRYQAPRK